MSNLNLYLTAVLIWGSTWLAITWQAGPVPAEVSVALRFGLAGLLLLGWCRLRRIPLRFTPREHGWIALQGATMFGANYVLVYLAEQRIPSGLMAVLFSLLAALNLLGARLWFGSPLRPAALAGTVLGLAGVALVCLPGATLQAGPAFRTGVGLALAATVVSSFSNLLSQGNQRRGLPVVSTNALGMLYGAAFVALYAAALGRPFALDLSTRYVASLAYLAVFGSVLAFGAYLTLVGRIGAGRAGYAMVAIPVVALALSTAFEHLHWGWPLGLGAALCLAGNLLVLAPPGRLPAALRVE
ncbi:MAG TPA: EamA family transporter [Holophagaceae bacterium]|nr:EamA family transporter [Holophagaceae bacterium]